MIQSYGLEINTGRNYSRFSNFKNSLCAFSYLQHSKLQIFNIFSINFNTIVNRKHILIIHIQINIWKIDRLFMFYNTIHCYKNYKITQSPVLVM